MKKNYQLQKQKWRSGIAAKITAAFLALSGVTTAQLSYTFTTAGATGSVGPTQTQLNNAYSSTSLNNSVTSISGIQSFTIPECGVYRVTAWGAQGGYSGGNGAIIAGTFSFTTGQVLKIIVGQEGTTGTNSAPYKAGGGGGGSYVADNNGNTPLIVAGGGGGNGDGYSGVPVTCCQNGMEASITESGNPYPGGSNGGSSGNGGNCSGTNAGGGAGFYGNGAQCGARSAAQSFVNGGLGGGGYASGGTVADGGFGGGGGHYDTGTGMRGGGGGGYSGGGGGTANTGNDAAGGGGSSFCSSLATNSTAVVTNTGNGKVTISQLSGVPITLSTGSSTTPILCAGQTITLTTSSASSYTWSNGSQTQSIVVSPTTNTFYTVKSGTNVNCPNFGIITLTVSPGLPVISISNPSNNICLGRSATLTASGALTYTWTNAGIINGQTFTPTITQAYTVTGTNGCGNTTSTTTITVFPLPVTVSASPTLVCQGYPSTLTAVSGVNGYTWTPSSPNASLIVINPTQNVVYTVVASDGTCSGTSTVAVNTQATPTIMASTNNSVFCNGGSAVLNASGASTYVWSPGNQPGASITVTPNASVAYQVAGTNSLGCVGLANVVIVVKPNPTVTAVTNKTLVCENGAAVLTANGANSYSWTNGASNSKTFAVTPAVTTQYTVTGTAQNGCTDEEVVSVSVYMPVLNVVATPTGVCPGGLVNVSATTHNGTNFKWNGVTGSSFQLAPTSTTVYVATANSNSNSVICPATNSIQVTVYPNPVVTATANKTVMCRNEKQAVITAEGGSTYTWLNFAVTTNTFAAPNTVSGSYVVTGTDANGCKASATVAIVVNPCTGIEETGGNTQAISIYPNPSKGTFNINTTEDATLNVINELGQVIKTLNLSAQNNHSIMVENLPDGIYFVVGQTATSKINQKIIIAH